MKIDILTLFPEMIENGFNYSIPKRAQDKGLVSIRAINLRDFAIDTHGTVDDTPYGGGPGMILRVDVADKALEALDPDHKAHRIMLTPDGQKLTQSISNSLADHDHLILLCGRYEGFDARIEQLVDAKISIGQYVVSGGELPALVLADSVIRLIPGVLGNQESLTSETSENQSDYPQFTRPETYKDMTVPEILKSGHHAEIQKWRDEQRATLK